jgi:hypothetical protein
VAARGSQNACTGFIARTSSSSDLGPQPLCGHSGDSASRATVARVRPLALAALALLLVACGGKPRQTLADCLNGVGFLVSGSGDRATGTSPAGVAFTLRVYGDASSARRALARLPRGKAALLGRAVADWHGNPTPGVRLTPTELREIRTCVADTMGPPAAR